MLVSKTDHIHYICWYLFPTCFTVRRFKKILECFLTLNCRADLLDKLKEDATAAGLELEVRRVDVTRKEDITDLAKDINQLHILFNCAGYVHQGSIFDCTDEIFERSFNINLRSMFWTCKKLAPVLEDGGSIINMSSVCSSIKGAPNRFVLWM